MGWFTTYQDAVQHCVDYLGGSIASNTTVRDAKRAVLEALRDLVNSHHWSYLYRHGRIYTNTPFQDGTIQYQQSGGAYPLQLTLTTTDSGVWPAWASYGYVRVAPLDGLIEDLTNIAAFRVARRISDTVLTFDSELNPGQDIAAGTGYIMYQDTYLLPEDYIDQDQALYELNFGGMTYCHPREWLYENRYIFAEGVPQCYTIIGDPSLPGRMTLKVFPWPFDNRSIDFVYRRRPRALTHYAISTGTASVTGGDTTCTVTGVGTSWTADLVGSVIRLSSNSTLPTGQVLENPAVFESTIIAWTSSTSVIVMDTPGVTLNGVAYVVSDPIDIEPGAMLNAFFRGCERSLALTRTLKDKPDAGTQYKIALDAARAADSRSSMERHARMRTRFLQRLRDMPQGPDA